MFVLVYQFMFTIIFFFILLQIRDLRFIFDINKKAVSRYIFNMRHTGEFHRANFEYVPDSKLF